MVMSPCTPKNIAVIYTYSKKLKRHMMKCTRCGKMWSIGKKHP